MLPKPSVHPHVGMGDGVSVSPAAFRTNTSGNTSDSSLSNNSNNNNNNIHKRNYPFRGGEEDKRYSSADGGGGGFNDWEESVEMKSSKIAKICQTSFRPLVEKIFPDSEIAKLRVRHGAMPGQNFTSIIYAVEAHLNKRREKRNKDNDNECTTNEIAKTETDAGEDCDEVLHLVMKCFPNHPARQDFFRKIDIFRKELDVYRCVLPQLVRFQEQRFKVTDIQDKRMLNAFPQFYGGDYGDDYDRYWENYHGSLIAHGNFILLEDIRRTEGYAMHSKYEGLSLPHCKLVLSTLAKLHALSMAYIKVALHNQSSLCDIFPCLKETIVTPATEEVASALFNSSFYTSVDIVASQTGQDSIYSQKMRRFGDRVHWIFGHILAGNGDHMSLEEMLQTKPNFEDLHGQNKGRKRNSWFVLTHGDCYLDNILFKYNKEGEPISVKLVDLQMARENCLTIDLVNFIYLSTTQSFRKDNLEKLLHSYYGAFIEACDELGVEPPSDFTMANLTMKFQRAKIWGMINSLFVLPVALADAGGERGKSGVIIDVDDINDQNLTAAQMFDSLLKQGTKYNGKLYERVVQLVKEMVDEGVI